MTCFSAQEAVDFILAQQLVSSAFVDELGSDLTQFQSGDEVVDELVRRGHLTEYQRSQIQAGQADKLCFGPYRLVKPLAKGGMGEVFKAWQPRLNRFVALKFIHAEYLSGQSNALDRFYRESVAISQLQHPNIIVLYDANEIDGVPFIAMEFLEGMSLTEMVTKSGPLRIKQACEYMRQAALGLQHAYECGFVHRDIKPSNIVVSKSNLKVASPALKKPALVTLHDLKRLSDTNNTWGLDRVKILDMGIARLNDSLMSGQAPMTTLTVSGAVLGTPDYISPEQARDSSKVDIRADLYSLGCTLYYVLSGQPPFPGGTGMEKMIRHQCDLPTPIKELRRDTPETISRIVESLLAKRPGDRLQTPLDLARSLSKYLADTSSIAEPPIQLSDVAAANLPYAIPATGSGSASVNTKIGGSTNENSLVVLPPESMSGSWESLNSLGSVVFSEADLKVMNWEAVEDYHEKQARKGKVKPFARLDGHVGAVSGVAISRDGMLAASADVSGHIRVWDLNDANPRLIKSTYRRAEIPAIAFEPNESNCLVFGEMRRGRNALVHWDWQSDRLVEWGNLTLLGEKGFCGLRFTPDGELLIAAVGSTALTWRIANGVPTHRKILKGMDTSIRSLAVSPDRRMLAAAGKDTSLHFWRLGSDKWIRSGFRVKSQSSTITTMCYSPDGSMLAMAGLDKEITIWPMAEKSDDKARLLHGHASNVQYMQFVGDGGLLASVGVDGQVIFWDTEDDSIVRKRTLDMSMAYRIEMSEDGTLLLAGFTNGTVGVFCPDTPICDD